ncbi:MAG: S-layer family protein, partial [Desulfobacterales bacterium]|nr:S-layer family protein [Desulfobacterales bacterium]
ANLYLLNPYGFIFGQNASLDLSGSFHVSSADYLKFNDGNTYSAKEPSKSTLTASPIESFGFLGENPGSIKFEESFLKVPEGKTLSVVGGDIAMHNSVLFAEGGRINLASADSAGDFKMNETGIEAIGFTKFGEISILRDTDFKKLNDNFFYCDIEVSGTEQGHTSGSVYIVGGKFELKGGYIGSTNNGDKNGGDIDIRISGDMLMDSNGIANGGSIVSATASNGDAGNIKIISQELSISNAFIGSISQGNGDGGQIDIDVDKLTMDNGAYIVGVAFKNGKASDINIHAGKSINLSGNKQEKIYTTIGSSTMKGSSGSAGNVFISTPELNLNDAIINANTFGSGDGGYINLNVDRLSLTNGGWIDASTGDEGNAGKIDINAKESILISGKSTNSSMISILVSGKGNGGEINLNTKNLTINDQGIILATTNGEGNGGNINIYAETIDIDSTNMTSGGNIRIDTKKLGKGGNLTINSTDLNIKGGCGIYGDVSAGGDGGNILINSKNIKLYESGTIWANKNENSTGKGSNLSINADSILISGDGIAGKILSSGIYMYNISQDSSEAGKLEINTNTLSVIEGGSLSGATFNNGPGYDIYINASESILISGIENGWYSNTNSNTLGNGNAGRIQIITPELTISEYGNLSVSTFAEGSAGDIDIQVNRLIVKDGGQITSDAGVGNAGNISISAKESVLISGFINIDELYVLYGLTIPMDDKNMSSNISSTTRSSGNGGNIKITTPILTIDNTGKISCNSYHSGNAGAIEITADDIQMNDADIMCDTSYSGKGGDIVINTDKLNMSEDSSISSDCYGLFLEIKPELIDPASTFNYTELFEKTKKFQEWLITEGFDPLLMGTGDAGNININAKEFITISDDSDISASTMGIGKGGNITISAPLLTVEKIGYIESSCLDGNLSDGRQGDAGNITIDVDILSLNSGGQINATSRQGSGKAGDITVTAQESIDISGKGILSTGNTVYSDIESNSKDEGQSGTVNIITPVLNISDEGRISASAKGTGNGGDIEIQVDELNLANQGLITAKSEGSGLAGDIDIQTTGDINLSESSIETKTTISDGGNISLSLAGKIYLKNSTITTSVGAENGDGGNITIKEPQFVILNESNIIAKAYGGSGGDIYIKSDEFLKTPDSIVDASSELGIDGNIKIDSANTDVTGGLFLFNSNYMDISRLLKDPCDDRRMGRISTLTFPGKGGLRPAPTDDIMPVDLFFDMQ